jgi:drug/metabolite transporter (DMT)-like permease
MWQSKHPVLLLILAALLWSTGGLLIKLVDWNTLAIAGSRSAIAAATLYLLLPRTRWTFSKAQIGGAIAYTATVVLFVAATRLTTAANAIFLQYTAPVYVAILGALLLREFPAKIDYLLMLLALLGIGMFFFEQLHFEGFWGNICALASGLSFAFLVIALRKQKDASPVDTILLGNILTAVVCAPFFFSGPMPGVQSIAVLLVLGVFQLGLSYVFYAAAIKHVRALDTVLIGIIEPILNPLWVLLVIGEVPGRWPLAGGAMVLLAATLRGALTARSKRLPQAAIKDTVLGS